MSARQKKPFPAPSLNMVSKTLLLTILNWNKIYENWLTACGTAVTAVLPTTMQNAQWNDKWYRADKMRILNNTLGVSDWITIWFPRLPVTRGCGAMAENHQIAGEPSVTIVWFVCDITDWFIWIVTTVFQCSSIRILKQLVIWRAYWYSKNNAEYFYVMKYECDSTLLNTSLYPEHLWVTR